MIVRRLVGENISRGWDIGRVAKDAEPVYWMGGFGAQKPQDAAGIRFAIIAIDGWLRKPSRYDALRTAQARHDGRGRLAKWAVGGVGDRYGKSNEPMLTAAKLASEDLRHMRDIRRSQPGMLLYGACALATAIELQRCWTKPFIDDISIRIDLDGEIEQIALVASSINDAEAALGPKPSGDLAKDAQVMEVYDRRRVVIDERITMLLERVRTLKRYWENLKSLDSEFDRLEWLQEKSQDDGRDEVISAEQERQRLGDIERQVEEAGGASGAAVQSLIEDTRRILDMNENN